MIPAYGDGALVRETVTSVLRQEDPGWRLTVVDDGAGRLGDWVRGLGDERVAYHANPVRLGINRNFQRCVDLSSAELVVLLGADDRLLPDFVGRARRAARRHPDAAFLHTGARIIDGAGRPIMPLVDRVKRAASIRPTDTDGTDGTDAEASLTVGGERLAASLLRGNWMYFPSVVFRRGRLVAHGFRPGYDIVLDLDLYLRILRAGGQAVLLGRPGIEYRRHPDSLSSSGAADGSRFVEERAFFAEVAAELAAEGWPRAARAARWHLTCRLHAVRKLIGAFATGNHRSVPGLLRNAIALGAVASGAGPREREGAGAR